MADQTRTDNCQQTGYTWAQAPSGILPYQRSGFGSQTMGAEGVEKSCWSQPSTSKITTPVSAKRCHLRTTSQEARSPTG